MVGFLRPESRCLPAFVHVSASGLGRDISPIQTGRRGTELSWDTHRTHTQR